MGVKKIGVLTSSRADYGIYKPLLRRLSCNKNVDLSVIVFGMHLMKSFGSTVTEIEDDAYGVIHKVESLEEGDSNKDIVISYARVVAAFSEFWNNNSFDLVLALGDRFEMSAAVQSTIPFEIKIGHIHGGETTLGAIDNIYRHQITLASKLHFVAALPFVDKVKSITGSDQNVFHVGSLSIDALENINLPKWDDVRARFGIPDREFILVTFHPETVGLEKNQEYAEIIHESLLQLASSIHVVVTMPNADGAGKLIRRAIEKLKERSPMDVSLVESFGKNNYFSAMQACACLLGNTSSGILEAASFNKHVVNVGDRQKGRLRSGNVIDVSFSIEDIVLNTQKVINLPYRGSNVYYKANAAEAVERIILNEEL